MDKSIKDTILIGDQITLKFKTILTKGEGLKWILPERSELGGVEIIKGPLTDTLTVREGRSELESRIVITSFDSGTHTLPAFRALKIKPDGSTDTLSFDGGVLEVNTIQIDTASFKPFDVKGQMNYPFSVKEVLPWAGLLFLMLLLTLLLKRILKRLKERRGIFSAQKTVDPPYIVALREIERLKSEKLWQRDQKEFYSKLSDILRIYIEMRFNIQAMEQTSNEIINALTEEKIDKAPFDGLKELFYVSDLVKFAKYTANQMDCENSIMQAIRFVNSAHLQDSVANREELTKNEKGEK